MYLDWVIRFLPILAIVFIVNLLFLFCMHTHVKTLPGTKGYFQDMYKAFGPMKRGEKSASLSLRRPPSSPSSVLSLQRSCRP